MFRCGGQIFGDFLRYLAIVSDCLVFLAIFGVLADCGDIWQSVAILWQSVAILWQSVAIFGRLGQLCTCDPCESNHPLPP